MNEIIQIKCPFDGAVLSVKNQPGIESKSVTCPVCKNRYPFTQFKRVILNADMDNGDPGTDYSGKNSRYAADRSNLSIGKIKVAGTGISFRLVPGQNIIGRKATKSQADFQIDTGEKRSMSREHIVVEVKRVPEKGFVHYLSLYKEKVNRTFIGDVPLLYGDCIVLNHGDIIKLPDANLIFENPDEEGTDL